MQLTSSSILSMSLKTIFELRVFDTIVVEKERWKEDLCHAICVNNWSDTKAILDQHPNALTTGISAPDRTALHVAAQFGNITIVKELITRITPSRIPSNECLVNKNSDIVVIPSKEGFLPVTLAFANDFKEMGRYLYSVTPLECFTGRPGSELLHFCLQAQYFDIALNLLHQRDELLFVPNYIAKKNMPIHQIATLNTVISPSELIFWKRWIYDC
ncbi:hypothetical protein K1719_018340 [Acacia pycnantha]|nr:hypothetical protein K1719_018340 [Acacia pycnantha]